MRKQEIVIHTDAERERAIEFIRVLAPGKKWKVTISQYRKQRSLGQNALWHKWFGIIADETGDTAESVKEDMIDRFSPRIENKLQAGRMRPKRTHEFTTAEGAEFTERVYALAAEFSIWLPHPQDQGR